MTDVQRWKSVINWRQNSIGTVSIDHKFHKRTFKCRFLAEFTLQSSLPSECFQAVESSLESCDRIYLPKCHFVMSQNNFQLIYKQEPSTPKRLKHKIKNLFCSNHQKSKSQTSISSYYVCDNISYNTIAYCGIVPDYSNVFFLTRHCAEGLVCSVYVFPDGKSTQKAIESIGKRFERAHREWQAVVSSHPSPVIASKLVKCCDYLL